MSVCTSVWMDVSLYVGLDGCQFLRRSGWMSVYTSVWMDVSLYVGLDGCQFVHRSGWMSFYTSVWMDVSLYVGLDGCQFVHRSGWMSVCTSVWMDVSLYIGQDECVFVTQLTTTACCLRNAIRLAHSSKPPEFSMSLPVSFCLRIKCVLCLWNHERYFKMWLSTYFNTPTYIRGVWISHPCSWLAFTL
jgi:hypothetical protein